MNYTDERYRGIYTLERTKEHSAVGRDTGKVGESRDNKKGRKGKKKRTEIASQYSQLFDNRDVATMFWNTVDYYSKVGLVFRNEGTGEYKRMAICSRWNMKKNDWYKKRYWVK
jgi:hypothetical protein